MKPTINPDLDEAFSQLIDAVNEAQALLEIKSNNHQKIAIQELNKINDSLRNETERGCVVIGTAFLDEKLKELLDKVTAGNSKDKKSLFDATGPLGTLSGKTRIAYCFGLISEEAHHDLNVIRTIRNSFAHLSKPISLSEDKIREKCSSLRLPGFHNLSDFPRLAFTSSIGAITGELNEVIEELEPFTPRTSTYLELVEYIKNEQAKRDKNMRRKSK